MLCEQVLEMANSPHYLYRITILRSISILAPVMGSEITSSKLLPVVVNASKDRFVSKIDMEGVCSILIKWSVIDGLHFAFCRVANIKFNVAKVLQSLVPIVDKSVSIPISNILDHLFQLVGFLPFWSHLSFILFYWFVIVGQLIAANRWWRRQSVYAWLSWTRTQMWMFVILLTKDFSRSIMPRCPLRPKPDLFTTLMGELWIFAC